MQYQQLFMFPQREMLLERTAFMRNFRASVTTPHSAGKSGGRKTCVRLFAR